MNNGIFSLRFDYNNEAFNNSINSYKGNVSIQDSETEAGS